jgi:hypothetical protein
MKLRIKDNSIRLRLTQTEVGRIGNGDQIHSNLNFPGGEKVSYMLVGSAVEDPEIEYKDNRISISIPTEILTKWANSDEVSLLYELSLDHDNVLELLIEKDFACLTPREDEDESDLFPHPEQGKNQR